MNKNWLRKTRRQRDISISADNAFTIKKRLWIELRKSRGNNKESRSNQCDPAKKKNANFLKLRKQEYLSRDYFSFAPYWSRARCEFSRPDHWAQWSKSITSLCQLLPFFSLPKHINQGISQQQRGWARTGSRTTSSGSHARWQVRAFASRRLCQRHSLLRVRGWTGGPRSSYAEMGM